MMAIPKKKALPLKKVMLSEGAMPSEKPNFIYVYVYVRGENTQYGGDAQRERSTQ